MEYDLKKKIEFHGKALLRNAVFSVVWVVFAYFVLATLFLGKIDAIVIMLLAIYGGATGYAAYKRIQREKKYYYFKPGNPTFDYLTEFGDPHEIVNEIDAEIKEGMLYGDLRGPNSSAPEALITKNWFVHLNKMAIIIPLKEIVCAYIYDRQTGETPDERTEATYFKALYLVITYGKGKEAIIKHSAIRYKNALAALDKQTGCKITYTRELKALYETDYAAFTAKVTELRGNTKGTENETVPMP